jgi:hypothetical protein
VKEGEEEEQKEKVGRERGCHSLRCAANSENNDDK